MASTLLHAQGAHQALREAAAVPSGSPSGAGAASASASAASPPRPRPRRATQRTLLYSALLVDLLQLIFIPSLHLSRQLALRAGCPALAAAASPPAASAPPADPWATASGKCSSGTHESLLASSSVASSWPSRPAFYIDAYDQWVVRHFPCNRGMLGRAVYTFSRLYPFAFATNAFLDMSEVCYVATLALSVACALACRACGPPNSGHEPQHGRHVRDSSGQQLASEMHAEGPAQREGRRRRNRASWRLRWTLAHQVFSLSARLMPHVGNIWSLLLFRRRYGPSVGGMVVQLTGSKYTIASNRLQGCGFYFLAGLLATQVQLSVHAALAVLEWILLVVTACLSDSLTHGSFQWPLPTLLAMAATVFAPVVIIHGPAQCYHGIIKPLVRAAARAAIIPGGGGLTATARRLHMPLSGGAAAATPAQPASGGAESRGSGISFRWLLPSQKWSWRPPKAPPSPPPPHLAPQSPPPQAVLSPTRLKVRLKSLTLGRDAAPPSPAAGLLLPAQDSSGAGPSGSCTPAHQTCTTPNCRSAGGSCFSSRSSLLQPSTSNTSSAVTSTSTTKSIRRSSTSCSIMGGPSSAALPAPKRQGADTRQAHGSPRSGRLSPVASPVASAMTISLASPATSPPTTKRHRRHARHAAKTRLTPATSLYCDSQPTSAPSSPPSEGERPSQASTVRGSSAVLRASGASGPYLPSAAKHCGTAVAPSEAGAGRTSPQDKAPAGPLTALHTPGPSPWTPSFRRPSLDLAILLGPVSPSVAATAAAASGASSAYDRMQTSPYTPAGRAQALSPCICTPGRTQAAAMSPAAAAAATRCSPLYTSGLQSCVMSCKVREGDFPAGGLLGGGIGGGCFPSTALSAVSAASLSAQRSANRAVAAAAAAGGAGRRQLLGLGGCVVRGCVHLLQVVRMRRTLPSPAAAPDAVPATPPARAGDAAIAAAAANTVQRSAQGPRSPEGSPYGPAHCHFSPPPSQPQSQPKHQRGRRSAAPPPAGPFSPISPLVEGLAIWSPPTQQQQQQRQPPQYSYGPFTSPAIGVSGEVRSACGADRGGTQAMVVGSCGSNGSVASPFVTARSRRHHHHHHHHHGPGGVPVVGLSSSVSTVGASSDDCGAASYGSSYNGGCGSSGAILRCSSVAIATARGDAESADAGAGGGGTSGPAGSTLSCGAAASVGCPGTPARAAGRGGVPCGADGGSDDDAELFVLHAELVLPRPSCLRSSSKNVPRAPRPCTLSPQPARPSPHRQEQQVQFSPQPQYQQQQQQQQQQPPSSPWLTARRPPASRLHALAASEPINFTPVHRPEIGILSLGHMSTDVSLVATHQEPWHPVTATHTVPGAAEAAAQRAIPAGPEPHAHGHGSEEDGSADALAQAAAGVTATQLHSWLTRLLPPVCAPPSTPSAIVTAGAQGSSSTSVPATPTRPAIVPATPDRPAMGTTLVSWAEAGTETQAEAAATHLCVPLACYPETPAVCTGGAGCGSDGATVVRLVLSPEAVAEATEYHRQVAASAREGPVGQKQEQGKEQQQQQTARGPTVRVVVSGPDCSSAWVDQEVEIAVLRDDVGIAALAAGTTGGGDSAGAGKASGAAEAEAAVGGLCGTPAVVAFKLSPTLPSGGPSWSTPSCGMHVYLLLPPVASPTPNTGPRPPPPRRSVLCVCPLLLAADPRVAAEVNGALRDAAEALRQQAGAAPAGPARATKSGAVRQLSYDPYIQLAFEEHVLGLVADMAALLLQPACAPLRQLAGSGGGEVQDVAEAEAVEEVQVEEEAAAAEAVAASETLLPYLVGRGMWASAALVVQQLQGRWGVAVRGAEELLITAAAAGAGALGAVPEAQEHHKQLLPKEEEEEEQQQQRGDVTTRGTPVSVPDASADGALDGRVGAPGVFSDAPANAAASTPAATWPDAASRAPSAPVPDAPRLASFDHPFRLPAADSAQQGPLGSALPPRAFSHGCAGPSTDSGSRSVRVNRSSNSTPLASAVPRSSFWGASGSAAAARAVPLGGTPSPRKRPPPSRAATTSFGSASGLLLPGRRGSESGASTSCGGAFDDPWVIGEEQELPGARGGGVGALPDPSLDAKEELGVGQHIEWGQEKESLSGDEAAVARRGWFGSGGSVWSAAGRLWRRRRTGHWAAPAARAAAAADGAGAGDGRAEAAVVVAAGEVTHREQGARAASAAAVASGGGGGAEPQEAGAGSVFGHRWEVGHGVLRDHQPLPVYLPTDALVWLLFALKHLLIVKHVHAAGLSPTTATIALMVCIAPPLVLLLLRPHTYARHRIRVIMLMYELPWQLLLTCQAAWRFASRQQGEQRGFPAELLGLHDMLRLLVTPGLFGIHPGAVAIVMAFRAVPYGLGLVQLYGLPVAASAVRVVLMLLSAVCTAALLRQLRRAGDRAAARTVGDRASGGGGGHGAGDGGGRRSEGRT